MTAPVDRLKALRGSEPVRLVLWPAIGLLVAYGVQRGFVTGDAAPFVLSVLALVLGVPATAAIRAQVTPVGKVGDVAGVAAGLAINEARDLARNQFGPDGVDVVDAVAEQIEARVRHVGRHRVP